MNPGNWAQGPLSFRILLAQCLQPPSPDAQAVGLTQQSLVNQALRGLEPPQGGRNKKAQP